MGLKKVVFHVLVVPQEEPLSHYHNKPMVEYLVEDAGMADVREWLSGLGIDTKVEIYKFKEDRTYWVRCILYADMEPEDEILLRLTFDRP